MADLDSSPLSSGWTGQGPADPPPVQKDCLLSKPLAAAQPQASSPCSLPHALHALTRVLSLGVRSDPELPVLLLAQPSAHAGWLSGPADGLAHPEDDGQRGHPRPRGTGDGTRHFLEKGGWRGGGGRTRRGWASSLTSLLAQGFHRYSTDRQWHVPHFEKMLYDQAQLTVAYSQAFQVTPDRSPEQRPLAGPLTPDCCFQGFPGDMWAPAPALGPPWPSFSSQVPRRPPHPLGEC